MPNPDPHKQKVQQSFAWGLPPVCGVLFSWCNTITTFTLCCSILEQNKAVVQNQ